jgi:hypothetical protein
MASRLRVVRFIWGHYAAGLGMSQKKIKNIFRNGENEGFAGENALFVSLSSARLSARQAVCTFPTDEIDR